MTKTALTRQVEAALWRYTEDAFGCFEVTMGWWGREIVDFITYKPNGEFRCYEIKVSKADFNSKATLSFHGDFNYYVMPCSLYDELCKEKYFEERVKNRGIGLITVSSRGHVFSKINAKRKTVNMSTRSMMLESMVRSLNREAKKYYQMKPYWGNLEEAE